MIGSLSESALMMRGSSASSGRLLVTREMASRTSLAATLRSVESENSRVTRLDPKDEVDDMDFKPATRATAPSTTVVSCWSIVCGEAPSKVVRTVITGRSTSGSSRTSIP